MYAYCGSCQWNETFSRHGYWGQWFVHPIVNDDSSVETHSFEQQAWASDSLRNLQTETPAVCHTIESSRVAEFTKPSKSCCWPVFCARPIIMYTAFAIYSRGISLARRVFDFSFCKRRVATTDRDPSWNQGIVTLI